MNKTERDKLRKRITQQPRDPLERRSLLESDILSLLDLADKADLGFTEGGLVPASKPEDNVPALMHTCCSISPEAEQKLKEFIEQRSP